MVIVATAPDLPILFVGMLATGTASIWMIAAANTLVQLRTAPELRGRVMGAWTMALPGTIPITALVAGAVADLFGARVAFAAAGAGDRRDRDRLLEQLRRRVALLRYEPARTGDLAVPAASTPRTRSTGTRGATRR